MVFIDDDPGRLFPDLDPEFVNPSATGYSAIHRAQQELEVPLAGDRATALVLRPGPGVGKS